MNKLKGFSLIEAMVVIVIIALVVSYALPNYRNYVLRSKRTEAVNALMQVAHMQERHYANTNRYGNATEIKLNTIFPAPAASNDKNYLIELASTNTTYTVTASARKGQTEDTDCLTFTINHLGVKTPTSGCWD
ncbi:MAG: type IV pilin protein [Marinicella sp.]|nr:prepilin-type N-terminal cleavage/methylation domain-containing protein [Xanthomonadales bacterium]